MKRSSWASGSSNVPLCSIGFWVAITRNGAGSLKVSLPIVTCRSCIASSSALCTLGAARLISSARSRLVKIGPLWIAELVGPLVEDLRAEDVRREQVDRELDPREMEVDRLRQDRRRAASWPARARPASSRWPPVNSAISSRSTTTSWPTTTVPTRSRTERMNSSVSAGIWPEPPVPTGSKRCSWTRVPGSRQSAARDRDGGRSPRERVQRPNPSISVGGRAGCKSFP